MPVPVVSAVILATGLATTDEWYTFFAICLSVNFVARWKRMPAGVSGKAWTSDGQTNGIIFFQFVCSSTLLHYGSGCRWCRWSPVVHGMEWNEWTTDDGR